MNLKQALIELKVKCSDSDVHKEALTIVRTELTKLNNVKKCSCGTSHLQKDIFDYEMDNSCFRGN